MKDAGTEFKERNGAMVERMAADDHLRRITREWFIESSKYEYSYHFTWMGRPIIQFPQDLVAAQEIIWSVQPDLIIETGIAHGGSIIFYASMLELIGRGRVLGIDREIRPHNRAAIEAHPMYKRIDIIEGSSVDPEIVAQARRMTEGAKRVMVALDSNHTHDHVLRELELYSPLVTPGSYLLVFDTVIEEMPESFSADRPWKVGNNPHTAVRAFLNTTDRFEIDTDIHDKLLITVARDGYLRCVKP
jgi:cephalosporin hydroxylase